MKSNELRIGNLVWSNYGAYDRLEDYVVLLHEDFLLTKGHGKSNIAFHFIEPIPLTEEWLLKMRAERDNHISNCHYIYSRFRLIWREDYKFWYVIDKEDNTYLTKVEFVHEWQNFIFVMDGEELTIKEQ